MKSLTNYITEKMVYTKANASKYKYFPKTKEELKDIINKLVDEQSMEDVINLNSIDTSKITDMSNLFKNYEGLLKIDISNWDVSNVKHMDYMFCGCVNLEKIIGIEYLDASNVTDMNRMFQFCKSFNQDISNWNVSNVINMAYMFHGCKSFNQDISKWDISKVKDMYSMFKNCASFNQDISSWDVSNISTMWMFNMCPIEEKYKPKFK